MLYKINIDLINNNIGNIYYDSEEDFIYYFNDIDNSFNLRVINPFIFNTDSYNNYNYCIIEVLKLYDMWHILEFIKFIKDMIKNKEYKKIIDNNKPIFKSFKGLNIGIEKRIFNLKDYKINDY